MSQENVELVREANAAFEAGVERGDFGAAWDTGAVAEDVEFIPAAEIEGPVVYRGREGFVEFMRRWTEDWEDWSYRLDRLIDTPDDRVIAFLHQSAVGKGSRVPVDLNYGSIWELEEGRVIRVRLYLDYAQALKAAGLRE
jgi:ketosteroid isomerase-like protein